MSFSRCRVLPLVAAGLTLAALSVAQTPGGGIFRQPPVVKGPTPHLADGTVDLSGTWNGGGSNSSDISKALKPGDTVSMQPWAEKVFKGRLAADDPESLCLPFGIPRSAPYPWRILQTPTHYFILYEGNIHSYRQIFMDGRKHPEDPDPTWYGHSVGRWDGDTLVVDTVGFNDKFWFDFVGHPHTERLHTIERYTRPNLGTLVEDVTIDDPGAYARPFTIHSSHRLLPQDELLEYICNENERDRRHLNGPARRP